jgi:hypothetical protein
MNVRTATNGSLQIHACYIDEWSAARSGCFIYRNSLYYPPNSRQSGVQEQFNLLSEISLEGTKLKSGKSFTHGKEKRKDGLPEASG